MSDSARLTADRGITPLKVMSAPYTAASTSASPSSVRERSTKALSPTDLCVCNGLVASAAPSQGENAYFVSVRADTAGEIWANCVKLSDKATTSAATAGRTMDCLYGVLNDRYGKVWVLDVVAWHDAG